MFITTLQFSLAGTQVKTRSRTEQTLHLRRKGTGQGRSRFIMQAARVNLPKLLVFEYHQLVVFRLPFRHRLSELDRSEKQVYDGKN